MPAVVLPRADPPFPGSLPEFQRLFPDDAACAAYLEAIRWRDGFVCKWCGEASEPYRFANRPQVLRCRKCQRDNALTAGTVMERTRTPLSIWFWAAPGFEPYARHLGRPIPAPAWLEPLRDGIPDPP
jgi:Transposase zinc-ribbon domain